MKPCSKHRKPIAWLVVGELDARRERDLRAHLETCEGCRAYLDELSHVTEKLASTEISSDIQASESFHQKLMGRLKAEEPISTWDTLSAQLQAALLNWRVALPAIGATALVIAALFIVLRPPAASPPVSSVKQALPASSPKTDPAPTLATYQMVANRSLDKLEELLTREGNRNPSPAPIYTASTLSLLNASD